MKKLSIIFICSIIACNVFGQQDMGYSQNMFNQMTVNPGYAGSTDMICINALQRLQWLNVVASGAPKSTVFSVNTPFTLFERSHGVGLTIINNTVAYNRDLGLKLSYAYRSKMKFGDGKIGLGISLGYINSSVDFSKISNSLGGFGAQSDLALPTEKKPKGTYDLGAGIYYNTEKLYLGISATHIYTGNLNFGNSSASSTTTSSSAANLATYYYVPHIYITAGYSYQLGNPMPELVPSFFIQSVGSVTTVNFNTNLVYNNRLWGGVSYRAGSAFTGLFGLELAEGIRFGVAYDYETTDIGKVSNGSLEVTVIYCFKLKKEKLPQKYKSIRFL
jgi:type IX secretion system PorP/SprF family membrane protein